MKVLVDSSAVLALLNRNDKWHQNARDTLEDLVVGRNALILTNFLVAETHALLLAKLGPSLARAWLLTFDWNLLRLTPDDEAVAREIIRQYQDKDFSFTDATSFAVMDRYAIETAFTYDRHFQQYRLSTIGLPPS